MKFFIDITFKIIPKKFNPYKLMVLSGIPKLEKIPRIISFILAKYLDHIAYDRIFNYLTENFNFSPIIIHSDFEKSIQKAISQNKYFKKKIIYLII